ncbi:MAG: glycosyltransferase [Parvularculaceae bacterium]|nr:glycosyltransferase [Parvularculaceae bacterium]
MEQHKVRARVAARFGRDVITRSGLFDEAWYLARYPDVAGGGFDAVDHYLRHGADEGRDPSPVFETAFYIAQYPGLDPLCVNPLCHYVAVGEDDGAWPNRFFDPAYVRASEATLPAGQGALLARYLAAGADAPPPCAGFVPSPLVRADGRLVSASPLVAALASLGAAPALAPRPPRPAPVADAVALNFAPGGDLVEAAAIDGRRRWRVTGADPYFVLTPRSGVLAAGHYRLYFEAGGLPLPGAAAKLYIDSGAGWSEEEAAPLFIEPAGAGFVSARATLPVGARALRFDPVDAAPPEGAAEFAFAGAFARRIGRIAFYTGLMRDLGGETAGAAGVAVRTVKTALAAGPAKAAADLRAQDAARRGEVAARRASLSYAAWIEAFDTITDEDRAAMGVMIDGFATKPLISVVMPVYNTPERLLREAIDSVLAQTYPHWEFCIADDASTKAHVRRVLEHYAAKDSRIKVVFRPENGHISRASNSALDLATGDWIALLDHDDLLPPHALFCVAETINRRPDVKMIYSDEDKIDLEGRRHDPYFKSDWNYRLFLSHNMFSHFGIYSSALVKQAGGFRAGYEGAQDYDLALRCIEQCQRSEIVHIPHVLYHWRVMEGSTAMSADEKPYAMIAGEHAITSHLERVGVDGRAELLNHGYIIRLAKPTHWPSVTIIVPTRDGGATLERCMKGVLTDTDYPNFDLVIMDNGSVDRSTLSYLESLCQDRRVRVFRDDRPFNYSALNNDAAKYARGDFLLFLNDDIEIEHADWLCEMVKFALLDEVGAVGARLWYPNDTLQHFGLILSPEHVAMNMFKRMPRNNFGYFGRGALTQEVSAATAACLLVRRSDFSAVGGFDEEKLPIAYNDVDLCLKIGKLGRRNIVLPHVNATHHESASRGLDVSAEKLERLLREKNVIRARWVDTLSQDPAYNPNLTDTNDDFSLASPPRQDYPWRGRVRASAVRELG